MKISKVAAIGLVLSLWFGYNYYTKYSENQKLVAQKAAEEAQVKSVLVQAQDAFTKANYDEVRKLIQPYLNHGDEAIAQLAKNSDKAEVLAYQLEQSDFYKTNPPVEVNQWELKTGGMDYSYLFHAATNDGKGSVEFAHDKSGTRFVAVNWYDSNATDASQIEREQFISGLVKAIFPQIEIPNLIAYIRANENRNEPKGWDFLPRVEINGVRVYVGSAANTLIVGFGGGTTAELSKIVEYAPDAVECKVLIKQWLAEGTTTKEILEVLPNAKSKGRCYDTPVSISTIKETDPRNIFKVGAHFESDDFGQLMDKHFPNAKYSPNLTVQVDFEGKQYLIVTQKISHGSKAAYEILAVFEQ
jgi:hypothetical protein